MCLEALHARMEGRLCKMEGIGVGGEKWGKHGNPGRWGRISTPKLEVMGKGREWKVWKEKYYVEIDGHLVEVPHGEWKKNMIIMWE